MPFPALLLIVALAIGIGRFSRRPSMDRHARNPWLYAGVGVALLAANTLIGTTTLVSSNARLAEDNSTLRSEGECRAELAAPVNDATADVVVGLGRGLSLVVAGDDPELRERAREALGEEATLEAQVLSILSAASELEKADADRGDDPVGSCREGDG